MLKKDGDFQKIYFNKCSNYAKSLQLLILPQKLRDFGIKAMMHIKNAFINEKNESWIMIVPTVHTLFAHSWELFTINSGASIAKWSESPLESWNKYVRAFQSGVSSRARQCSIKANIHDIFKRMLINSNPLVASRKPRPSCTVCGEQGHSARSGRHKNVPSLQSEEEAIVVDLYQ